MSSLDARIQSYIDQGAAVGASVALLKGGEVVYLGAFGVTTVAEHGIKVTSNTLFYYGSICKNFCAALILRLVEQEVLALDTPIVHYLPNLHFSNAEYGKRVTLRHLLSHTSGLPMGGKYWGPRDPDALRRFVYEQIPYYTFLSEPGVVHLYSNTVFCVAGHVAEAVTGRFYDDLMQEYVFDPLQMSGTTFDPVVAITRPVALRHERGSDGKPYPIPKLMYNVSGNPSSFALGTIGDVANLAQMYLNQGQFGGQTFLTPVTIADMQRSHADRGLTGSASAWLQVSQGYGLGFEVGAYRGRRAARHGGATICYFDLFPDDQAGVILLTNYTNDPVLMPMLIELYEFVLDLPRRGIFFLDRPATVAPLDSRRLQRYQGAYVNVETANVATFVTDAGQLILEQQDNPTALVPIGSNQFYAEFSEKQRLPIAFIEDGASAITHVMIGGEPYHPLALDPIFQPDVALWQAFGGLYKDPSNTNRDEMLTVRLDDGVLFIAEGENEVSTRPISNHCFLSDLGMFEFVDSDVPGVKILVLGKATRLYPVDQQKYNAKKVIQYLVEVPVVQQRVA